MNLYDNSNIDCNKKNKNKLYDLYNNIVLNKFVHSNKHKNNFLFGNYKQGHFILIVCFYHVTYDFESESTLYSCLNVKELLARSRCHI